MSNWALIDRRDRIINAIVFAVPALYGVTLAAYLVTHPFAKDQTQPVAQTPTATIQMDRIFASARNIDPTMLNWYGKDCVKYEDRQVVFAIKDTPKDDAVASDVI